MDKENFRNCLTRFAEELFEMTDAANFNGTDEEFLKIFQKSATHECGCLEEFENLVGELSDLRLSKLPEELRVQQTNFLLEVQEKNSQILKNAIDSASELIDSKTTETNEKLKDSLVSQFREVKLDFIQAVQNRLDTVVSTANSLRNFLGDYKAELSSVARAAVLGEVSSLSLAYELENVLSQLQMSISSLRELKGAVSDAAYLVAEEQTTRSSIFLSLEKMDRSLQATNSAVDELSTIVTDSSYIMRSAGNLSKLSLAAQYGFLFVELYKTFFKKEVRL